MIAVVGATICGETIGRADDEMAWQPRQTRVFIVSLTRFKANRLHSFTTDDRLDDRFAQVFRDRGVPASQIVLLKDDEATIQNIKREFTSSLRKSGPAETLFFYFGSHGDYDPETGAYSFCAFNDDLSFSWVFDAIERDFRGRQALLTTDCCYSGGIIELAKKRKTNVAYACLTSTYAHQTAWSGWRFVQCLLRGLAGNPVVDLNRSGHVDLDELASYTARYMAFAAEGKPMFHVTANFNPKLRLATSAGPMKPRVGELLETYANATWEKSEVLDAGAQGLKIHFTKDTRVADDAWFATDRLRPFRFDRYPTGATVEVQDSSNDRWHSAKVLENWESLHLCRYDGYSSAYDEWFGPSRVRASVAGSWSGQWKNTLDEGGPETLVLLQSRDERLSGTWSGDVKVNGERIGKDTIYFEGTKPSRFYRCAGRIEGGHLVLNYVAHRTDGNGHYHGWAQLRRQRQVADAIPDPRLELSGNWTGTYLNSQGGSGRETLAISENADELRGVWSGVNVRGERLGNAMYFLKGSSGQRHYHVIGHVANGRLVLHYSATEGDKRYTGRSALSR